MAKFPFSLVRVLLPALMALPLVQCDVSRCEKLRDELQAQKISWGECETSADCIKVFGSRKDCTGIMSCDFAVNRRYRQDAERRVASLPEESIDCIECQSPNCVRGDIGWCEPVTHQCIVITELVGGVPTTSTATGGSANEATGGSTATGGLSSSGGSGGAAGAQ